MALLQITYVSRATERLRACDLPELIASARRHNESRNITGALYFADGRFIQVLEGAEHHLMPLYGSIVDDPRHTKVETVSIRPIETPRFAGWGLGHLPAEFVTSAAREAIRAARTPGSAWADGSLTEILAEFERALRTEVTT